MYTELEAGTHPKVAAERLGHSSISHTSSFAEEGNLHLGVNNST